jgi:transposase InsO family protein
MDTLSDLHPGIQYAVRRLTNPDLTFEKLGTERGISKQAVEKQCKKAVEHLKAYAPGGHEQPEATPCSECTKKDGLIALLRRQLILAGVQLQGLKFFKEQVLKFFPKFKVTRLPALEKKQVLDWLDKFKRAGGLVKDFARHIGRSPETLARWQAAYDKHGLSGLIDKSTKPKNFGNRVPLWIKKHLLMLFMQFPRWTPYQYHSHIRHNPATNWYLSLPVITKLKSMMQEKSEAEKERIKKRWCFAPGTKAWTADFTCILKTPYFKLQVLTVSDHRSRYLLHSALYLNTSVKYVMNDLEELFIKYGIPDMIKADNGPEFRLELREQLKDFAVYLINSPEYYGQFNGAHERIHRKLKEFIDQFAEHQSLTKLVSQIQEFVEQYNYKIPMDSLGGKTPADVFLSDEDDFMPEGAEVVKPYEKDGELRMKFTDRDGYPARISVPLINQEP